MSSPYNNGYNNGHNNGYGNNSYAHDPTQRAPSPYHDPYGPDPNQRAPSPYQQGASNSYYDQHPHAGGPAYTPSEPSPVTENPNGEGERGILGAIGGGLTGGFVGKQTSHGFLGTVGGAIVGSLTEDWAKKKRASVPGRPVTPTNPAACSPPGAGPYNNNRPPMYNAGYVDSQTTVATTTQVQPGYWQGGPPPGPQQKPCGHHNHCACSFFGKQ